MKNYALLLSFALALFVCSCKKDIDVIGLNLQDEDILGADFVEVPITAYSVLEDSVNTKNLLNNVVGEVNDPTFGNTSAGFCTQFDVSGSNTFFPKQAVLDSVVLTLQYSGCFGDTLSPIKFHVHELAEPLDHTYYYSNEDQPSIQSGELMEQSNFIYPQPYTSYREDTTTKAAHARLKLTGAFGYKLLRLNKSALATTESFQNAFYGLCVSAEARSNKTGNLCYVSLTSAMSGITLYYTVDRVHKSYTFPVSSSCVRYNYYTHDYSRGSSDFQRQVLQGETSLGSELLYLQSTAGVKTRVKLDELTSTFKDKNVIINRAELVVTDLSSDNDFFYRPYNLSLQILNSDGTTTYTQDDATYTSTSYFGGIYDEDTKEYRFRITNYIQHLVRDGIDDQGLNLVVSGSGIRGNRLIFRGTDPSYTDHFRLEIYYTEY